MTERLLVVGAIGFAGRHFVETAGSSRFEVLTSSRRGHGADFACDLAHPGEIAKVLGSVAPDCVLNLAGWPNALLALVSDPELRGRLATFRRQSTSVPAAVRLQSLRAP